MNKSKIKPTCIYLISLRYTTWSLHPRLQSGTFYSYMIHGSLRTNVKCKVNLLPSVIIVYFENRVQIMFISPCRNYFLWMLTSLFAHCILLPKNWINWLSLQPAMSTITGIRSVRVASSSHILTTAPSTTSFCMLHSSMFVILVCPSSIFYQQTIYINTCCLMFINKTMKCEPRFD